tara:strand:+ start:344 stop:1000 length:657 start_codon:yes stop_codon:yes gene_type:complete
MNHSLIPLFSIPLFKSNIGSLDPITLTWIKRLSYPLQAVGHDGSDNHLPQYMQGMKILHKEKLKNLKAQIERTVDYFVHELLDVEDHINFEIQASWINKIEADDKNSKIIKHGHAGAIISGVYYIDTDDTTAPITFEKSYNYNNLFPISIPITYKNKNTNQYNMREITLHPKSGDLMLFPSQLEHTVPSINTLKDRYGIAFNCFPKGNIGYGSEHLLL